MRYFEVRKKQPLTEHIVNALDIASKEKYGPEVWSMLNQSYAKIGGYKTATDLNALIIKSDLWKIIVRNNKVTAVLIYRQQHGRKRVGVGSDGTLQGKADLFTMMQEDIKLGRSWSEVSGVMEHIMEKFGAKPIPSKFAPELTKKDILSYAPDGYHYTRLILGTPHVKIIYGSLNFEPGTYPIPSKNLK